MKIEVYTDGSSIGNGKPTCVGGWSCVFFIGQKMYVRYGHLSAPSSNNRAETTGVLFAINMLQHKPEWDLTINSDSQYVVKSINEWRHGWKKNNYAGMKNADLFLPLFEAWDRNGKAKIQWVRGHIGVRGNEIADEYAGLGSRNIERDKISDSVNIKFVEKDWKPNGVFG